MQFDYQEDAALALKTACEEAVDLIQTQPRLGVSNSLIIVSRFHDCSLRTRVAYTLIPATDSR